MKSSLVALGLFLPGLLSAQGSTPGFTVAPKPSFMIINSVTSAPGTTIQQVQHLQLPTDKEGTWTTALTVGALEKFFGGDGKSSGVVLGSFDPFKGSFTPNLEAKALNSGSEDLYLMLAPDGLAAIWMRGTSEVYLARRNKTGTAFGKPAKVSGFGTLTKVTPALGRHGGKDVCFYTDGSQIRMAPIDLAKATVDRIRSVAVSGPVQKGARPFGPTPLHGGDGDCEGLFFSEEVSSKDSDMVWAGDLDPKTPPLMQMQRSDYTNHGSPASGFLSWAHKNPPLLKHHLMHSECAWLLGDEEGIGGSVQLTVSAVNPKASQVSSVLFGSAKAISKVVVPGFKGWLGVDPSAFVLFGLVVHKDRNGQAVLDIAVPNDLGLKGLRMAVQGVAVDPVRQVLTLTSTARIAIR